MAEDSATGVYEGKGDTLDAAAIQATRKLPLRPHSDFVRSRVIDWGVQSGGLTNQDQFYARVIADYGDADTTGK